MSETTIKMPAAVSGVLEPKPRWGPTEWAVRKPFEIREKGAVRPGPYDLELTPYWREPLDAIGDPLVMVLTWIASSQSGKTKAAEVGLTWRAKYRPSNMLYARPTEPDLVEAFRDRFAAMLEANVRELLPSGEWLKTTGNPVIHLRNLILYGAAATTPRHFTSRTTPFSWFDELDSGAESANNLGNLVDLMAQRQMASTSRLSLTLNTTTPKYPAGAGWSAYENQSDRRQYWEPCPHCGMYQPLVMERIVPVEEGCRDVERIVREDLARLVCRACGVMIEPQWQGWMSDRGRHVPACQTIVEALPLGDERIVNHGALELTTGPERWEPEREGPASEHPHRGYRVWRANAKFEMCGWSWLLADWFTASKSRDPERMQVHMNNVQALPWSEGRTGADEDVIRERIGEYEPGVVPWRVKVVVGAVDVQQDHLWYRFRGFGAHEESWSISEGTVEVHGEDYSRALDRIYEMAFYEGWPIKGEPAGAEGLRMRAYALAVDCGYRAGEVYEFSRRPGVVAVRGEDWAKYRVKLFTPEGKVNPEPVEVYHLNQVVMKDRLQRWIQAEGVTEEWLWNLHAETTEDVVAMMASEEKRSKRGASKIMTWQPKTKGRPNHLLDCESYIVGLLEALEQRHELSVMTLGPEDPALGVFRPRPRNGNGEEADGQRRGGKGQAGGDDDAGRLRGPSGSIWPT